VNSEDEQLIKECLAGQTEAFGLLVTRYQDRLYHTLSNILVSAEDARDVAQDAFVLAFQKLHTFRGDSAFYSWLFRIAYNSAISHLRKKKRSAPTDETSHEQTGIEPADRHPDTDPSRGLEVTEEQALVRSALAQLQEEYRTALVLKEMEGLKYEEIAEVVDAPIGTVRSRIHRARRDLREKLRILLKDELGDDEPS
jgi:RNA polymerase sigma-70 factor, ECF subfamily